MEYIMEPCALGKLKTIRHLPNALHHLKQAGVAWTELPLGLVLQ